MKNWKVAAIFGVAALTFVTTTAATAADTPSSSKPVGSFSSEEIGPLLKDATAENGFDGALVLWSMQNETLHVGLSRVQGKERALLESRIGVPVVVTKEAPLATMDKKTRVGAKPTATAVAGNKKSS